VIIEKEAFVGPNSVIACSAGRVLRIGEGAVIGPGSIITKSVPPRVYVGAAAPKLLARVEVPLTIATSMESFWGGLRPFPLNPSRGPEAPVVKARPDISI
jgi:tetrahydrodipicolinate N-succinyltransferase